MVLDPAADSGAFLLTCARMLAERAWSRSMIGDFLGNPDEQRPDPKSPRVGFPFRIYRAEHVFHVGATAAFAERVVIAARRASGGNISVTAGRCSRSASTSTRGAAARSRGGSIAWTGGPPRRSRPRWRAWELGNLSNTRSVGAGVLEYRIDSGPGYRIYLGRDGDALVVLLGGGTKVRQQRDIETARKLWREYRRRKRPEE